MDKSEKIEFLKEFMEKKKLNKSQCARFVCVTESAVRFWLKGEREIPDSIIELIKFKNIIKRKF